MDDFPYWILMLLSMLALMFINIAELFEKEANLIKSFFKKPKKRAS